MKLQNSLQVFLFSVIYLLSLSLYGQQRDLVSGNLMLFNDNGGWCWYQDERSVVDTVKGKLVCGYDESGSGVGGYGRNGVVATTIMDLKTRTTQDYDLYKAGCDDHNAPGIIIRPDGKYLAMYAQHYDYYNSRYRIFDGSVWAPEVQFDWTTIPGGTDYTIAYSNVYYLSAEGRMYNFARANHRCPNLLYSDDMGDTWHFGGQLSTNNSNSYNKGYYIYWGNGVDRIDFIFTEQHPRDTSTSIYHGYIKGGKSYTSEGIEVDDNVFDTLNIPTFKNFTKVFADNTVINGVAMRRCWNTDVMRYEDGTIATIVTARNDNNTGGNDNSINPQHSLIYCRYNGSTWSYTYLGNAGFKLYSTEADYTGLAAVHPNNPDVIYISTSFDPRDNTDLSVKEIFKGVTSDEGATWTWVPITRNSVRHNVRPIIPDWNNDNTALLWMRGTYNSAQNFDMTIVGIMESADEPESYMTYVDAATTNTTLANGSAIGATGPGASDGASDGLWHIHTGVGNNNDVFASAETAGGGENAGVLKTTVTVADTGSYDVWVNFYGNTTADWRVEAGFSESNMKIYRSIACKQVEDGKHTTSLVLSGGTDIGLYQAYVGRVHVTSGTSFDVFVDDEAVRTGSTTQRGNTERTWYDGISYIDWSNPAVIPQFPEMSLSDDTIDFGSRAIAMESKDSIRLTSTGGDTLEITNVTSSNPLFVVNFTSVELNSLYSKYLTVTYTPDDYVADTAYVIIESNVSTSPDTIFVFGDGRDPLPSQLTIVEENINFGVHIINQPVKDSVLLSNTGELALQISSVISSEPVYTANISNNQIAGGKGSYLIITYLPDAVGVQNGFIVITHDASTSPDTVYLSGEGRNAVPAMLSMDKTELNFGEQYVGTETVDSIYIRNDGEVILDYNIVTIPQEFTTYYQTNHINSGEGEYLRVVFEPDAAGNKDGIIVLNHNGSTSPDTVYIYAACIDYPKTEFTLSTQHLDFGVVFSSDPETDSILIDNTGDSAVVINFTYISNTEFTVAPSGINLNPGDSAYVKITFAPVDTLKENDYIIYTHNAAGSPDTIYVSGDGEIEVGIESLALNKTINLKNNPNPVTDRTVITYNVPYKSKVNLSLYDLTGKLVEVILNEEQTDGSYSIEWSTGYLKSGIYFCKIRGDGFASMNKLVIQK